MDVLKALLVTLVLWTGTVPAAIYRSVDEHGNVVFSDEPRSGATPVDLPPLTTYEAPKPRAASVLRPPASEPSAISYSKLEIRQPAHDATLRDNTGRVTVIAAIEPELRSGHRLQFYLDGRARGEHGTELGTSFSDVDRGAHQVEVAVVDAAGRELMRSESVQFYLHRQSVNFPARSPTAP